MQDPVKQISEYQDQSFSDIVFLLNSRFSLLKQLSERANQKVWRIAVIFGLLHTIYNALFDSLIVTLAWLYSKKLTDKRSLIWYLNQVKDNSKAFTKDEIDDQLNEIETHNDRILKIKNLRDKWITHRDPNAFNNRDQFLGENNLKIEDFEVLITLAEKIINKHFGRFQATEADFSLPSNDITDLARIINERNELLYFLEEFDIAKNKIDADERIELARKKLALAIKI